MGSSRQDRGGSRIGEPQDALARGERGKTHRSFICAFGDGPAGVISEHEGDLLARCARLGDCKRGEAGNHQGDDSKGSGHSALKGALAL